MKKFLNKAKQWLYSCSGPDAFAVFLVVLSAILMLTSRLLRMKWLQFPAALITVYALFRMLSTDRQKRYSENRRFLEAWKKAKEWCALRVKMAKEYKTHRYIRCPSCRAMLRVSRIKGLHTVACPHCGNRFETTIR